MRRASFVSLEQRVKLLAGGVKWPSVDHFPRSRVLSSRHALAHGHAADKTSVISTIIEFVMLYSDIDCRPIVAACFAD
eukprot:6209805-Pleurochrysis_carterae.AAC.2